MVQLLLLIRDELLQKRLDVLYHVFTTWYQVATIMQDPLPDRWLPQLVNLITQLLLYLPIAGAGTALPCCCIHMQGWQLQWLLLLEQLPVLRRRRHKPRCKDSKPWSLQWQLLYRCLTTTAITTASLLLLLLLLLLQFCNDCCDHCCTL
jgi:hypothetical protein